MAVQREIYQLVAQVENEAKVTILRQEIAKCEAEIKKFTEAVRTNPAALASSSAAIAKETTELQRLQREMTKAQSGARNYGSAVQAGSYAVQDFADASGGLSEKLRGVSNNIPGLVQGFGGSAGIASAVMLTVVAAKTLYDNWDSLLGLFGDSRPRTAAQEIEDLGKKTHLTANETERLAKAEKLRREQERAGAKATELSDEPPPAQKKAAEAISKAIVGLGDLPNGNFGRPVQTGFDKMMTAARGMGLEKGNYFSQFIDKDDLDNIKQANKELDDANRALEKSRGLATEPILRTSARAAEAHLAAVKRDAWLHAVEGQKDGLVNEHSGLSIREFFASPAALGKGLPDLMKSLQTKGYAERLKALLGGGRPGEERYSEFLGDLAMAGPHAQKEKMDDEASRKLRKRIEEIEDAVAENLPLLSKEEVAKATAEIADANKALGTKNLDKITRAMEQLDIFGDDFKDRIDALKDRRTLHDKLVDQIVDLEKWLDEHIDVLDKAELNNLRVVIQGARDKLAKQTEEAYREALNWLGEVFDKEFKRRIDKQQMEADAEDRLKDQAINDGKRQANERKKKAEDRIKDDPLRDEKALDNIERRAQDLAKVDPEERKKRIRDRGHELEVKHRGEIGGELGAITGRRLATPQVDAELAKEAPERLAKARAKAREEEIARLQAEIVAENRAAGNNIRETEAKALAEEKLGEWERDSKQQRVKDAASGKTFREANPANEDNLQQQFMRGLMGGSSPDQVRQALLDPLAKELEKLTPELGKDGSRVAAADMLKQTQQDVLQGMYEERRRPQERHQPEIIGIKELAAKLIIDRPLDLERQSLDVQKKMLDALLRIRPDLIGGIPRFQ